MPNKYQNKTVPTKASVKNFISKIKDEQKRKDSLVLVSLMRSITGKPAVMWGPSIIGFDKCHYKYKSGREGDMGAIGFSPRKAYITVYLVDGTKKYKNQLSKLGTHTLGKVCVYIKRLDDINMSVLEKILRTSYKYVLSHKNKMPRVE